MKRQYCVEHVPVRRKRKTILRRQHFYIEARSLEGALRRFRRYVREDVIVSVTDVTELDDLTEWLAST